MSDYTLIGPLTYSGKKDCTSGMCTSINGRCVGWHCSYCDAPCSYQGHRCDVAEAVLGESERALREAGKLGEVPHA